MTTCRQCEIAELLWLELQRATRLYGRGLVAAEEVARARAEIKGFYLDPIAYEKRLYAGSE